MVVEEREFNAALRLDMAAARSAISSPVMPRGMLATMKVGKTLVLSRTAGGSNENESVAPTSRNSVNWNNHGATEEEGLRELALAARDKQALDNELISPVGGGIKEHAANQSGPERVGLKKFEREIEHLQLACAGSNGVNGRPSARHQMQKRDKANNRAADVNCELDDVGPDDGGHAAFKGINERERHDDGNGSNAARPQGDADYDGDGPHANAFRRGARNEKNSGGDAMQSAVSEAAINKLVGGKHLAAKILRDKDSADDRIRPRR